MQWHYPALHEAKYVDDAGKIVAYVTRHANGDYCARLNDKTVGKYIDMESAKAAVEKENFNPNSPASRA